jgi:SPW repeat
MKQGRMNETLSKYTNKPSESGTSTLNLLIGIWLILSPFVLAAFAHLQNARSNNVIVGILVAVIGLVGAARMAHSGWSWFNVLLGIWLIASPFVLGFSGVAVAMWHNIIAGVVVTLLALTRSAVPHMHSHPATTMP